MRIRASAFILCACLVPATAPAEPVLPPCPPTPNCVSSLAENDHRVAPLRPASTAAASMARLERVLAPMKGVTWRRTGPDSLHAEFSSRVFRFVDDVDVVARENGTLHIRSASRTGYRDFGVNRRRVERLREALRGDRP